MTIKKSKIFRNFVWVANIILFMAISFSYYLSIPVKTTSTVFIPQGSVSTIISQLAKREYMLSFIDKYILVLMGRPQYGWINVGDVKLNRIDFLHKLVTSKAQMVQITLIPGETMEVFLDEVANELYLDATKLKKYYDYFATYKEAGIYADTYYVPLGIQEKHLMRFLIAQSNNKYNEISHKIYGGYDEEKWNNILTIASIIQKEAANRREMPLVSSVIYNRLKKNMRLQMDGTLNYGIYSHVKVTPERIKEDESPFNTYKHRGLPPYPVSAVSLASIVAAIKPASTNYLYFMKNSSGEHDFSVSYDEHKGNIQKNYNLSKD